MSARRIAVAVEPAVPMAMTQYIEPITTYVVAMVMSVSAS